MFDANTSCKHYIVPSLLWCQRRIVACRSCMVWCLRVVWEGYRAVRLYILNAWETFFYLYLAVDVNARDSSVYFLLALSPVSLLPPVKHCCFGCFFLLAIVVCGRSGWGEVQCSAVWPGLEPLLLRPPTFAHLLCDIFTHIHTNADVTGSPA